MSALTENQRRLLEDIKKKLAVVAEHELFKQDCSLKDVESLFKQDCSLKDMGVESLYKQRNGGFAGVYGLQLPVEHVEVHIEIDKDGNVAQVPPPPTRDPTEEVMSSLAECGEEIGLNAWLIKGTMLTVVVKERDVEFCTTDGDHLGTCCHKMFKETLKEILSNWGDKIVP